MPLGPVPSIILILASNGKRDYSPYCMKVCVDSRNVKRGDLFFALEGERTNGHLYLDDVATKGAAAAYVRLGTKPVAGLKLIEVPDPLIALQKQAKEKLATSSAKVIGVTGSLGKTTTKQFLKTLLEKKFSVSASPGNYNSQIGLPLAIMNEFHGDEEVVVLEMAMTGKGHIKRLTEIAPPDVAVITTVDSVHAGYFSGLASIAAAKAEIFLHAGQGLYPEGIVHEEILLNTGCCPKQSFRVDPVNLPVLGKHNQHNFAAAKAVCLAMNMTESEIQERIPFLTLPERRLELVKKQGVLFLNDSYNACVNSMKGALDTLPGAAPGRKKIAVLGAMVELGNQSASAHREVGEYALSCVDELYCLHEDCQPMVTCWQEQGRPVKLFRDRRVLVETLQNNLQPGDSVLLKGSNARRLWTILEEVTL